MTVSVFGVEFQNPIVLAAGTAGFGKEVQGVIDLDRLGGICTKAVSPKPRKGNPSPRVAEFDGGMLNSIGLANPGLDAVKREHLPWLEENLKRARVVVNVVGDVPDDYTRVVDELSEMEVVTAFELNVSCPNTDKGGEEFGADKEVLKSLVRSCVEVQSKPIIVKLAPTLPDIAATAAVAAEAGAAGFSLVNTMPGNLFQETLGGVSNASRLGAGRGGVSGPALLPIGVLATQRVVERTGLGVIGVGGVKSPGDVEQYLAAGASLVGVGTAALADPRVPERLVKAWENRG